MRKALALAIFAVCAAPMFASVQLDTSINDVFHRGSNELAGSITWGVTGDDFREASTDEPIFIRVTPDHNSFLSETLVRQSSSDLDLRRPINLAMRLDGGNGLVTMGALPQAVSIVRWVAGESSLWIRVQQTSDQWLQAPGGLVGPSVDLEVSWTIGISARTSDTSNESDAAANNSNLPFNSRLPDDFGGTTPTEVITDKDLSTSTLICVDLTASNLFADGSLESLLNYDIIAYDSDADLGGGVYSGQAGNDTGIDFTNDFAIARGKSRLCEVTVLSDDKDQDSTALLCIFRAASNGTQNEFVKLTNDLQISITCPRLDDDGNATLDTDFVAGSWVSFTTNGNGDYGFDEIFNVSFADGKAGHSVVSGSFTNNGRTLFTNANLIYDGPSISMSNGQTANLAMNTCVYTHYLDDEIQATLDWDVTILSHDGARDVVDAQGDFDGDDQYRRCSPSAYTVEGGEFIVGWFLECEGNPVSIFFPYLPIITGNSDFWVGLSYVNQGATDLNIEAIAYDEDGNRFSAELGSVATRNQHTWLLIENAAGVSTINGAGGNNDGQSYEMTPDDPNLTAADFGTSRSSLFVRGTFPATFLDDVFNGDLDGYLLVGNAATFSIDGAYLPRNYDNDIPGQNADLPLWRSKAAPAVSRTIRTTVQSTFNLK